MSFVVLLSYQPKLIILLYS